MSTAGIFILSRKHNGNERKKFQARLLVRLLKRKLLQSLDLIKKLSFKIVKNQEIVLMFKKFILVLTFTGLISACSSDGTSVVILPDGTPVEIVTVTGGMHTLNGSYLSLCYTLSPSGSRRDTLQVNDETWTNTANVYTSADCSGTAAVSTITATMVKGSEIAITGWVDGTATAPLAQDGSAPLSDNETVTKVDLTITEVTGIQFSPTKVGDLTTIFYVADDTNADPVTGHDTYLYRDDDADVNSDASTANPLFK